MTAQRRFLAIFGCLLAVITAENLGTPRNAGPDEPAHIIRGAGLVRGELLGEQYSDRRADHGGEDLDAGAAEVAMADPDSAALRVFDVPRSLTEPSEECYSHNGSVPASCSRTGDTSGRGAVSTAGWYPIWGHILPGLASLVTSSPTGLWLARFLHGVIPAILVAATLARLIGDGRRGAAAAVVVAVTPMTLFVFAVVNPSGLVAAGAIAVWVAADDVYRTIKAGPRPVAHTRADWLLPAGYAALVLPAR